LTQVDAMLQIMFAKTKVFNKESTELTALKKVFQALSSLALFSLG
jgi:hypothetical protein